MLAVIVRQYGLGRTNSCTSLIAVGGCSRAGKAAYCLGDVKRGKAEYRLAIVSDSSNLPAWEGLAELQMANGEVAEAQQTFEQLVRFAHAMQHSLSCKHQLLRNDAYIKLTPAVVMQLRLAIKSGNTLKQREYRWRSAEAFDRLGEFTDAEDQLKALQDMDLTKEQYLETLCHLADIQVCASYTTYPALRHAGLVEVDRNHSQQVLFQRAARSDSNITAVVKAHASWLHICSFHRLG